MSLPLLALPLACHCESTHPPTAEGEAAETGAKETRPAETNSLAAGQKTEATHCDSFAKRQSSGQIESTELDEISGIAASRSHPGTLYVHNDSGDSARFFAIDAKGKTRAVFALQGASARDWEDIAVGSAPGESRDWLYLADTGNNAAREGGKGREQVSVYRVVEPSSFEPKATTTLKDWEELVFSYPDKPHDCEAIAVDRTNGHLYFATKENDGHSIVFVARTPHEKGPSTLERVGELSVADGIGTPSRLVTGMDFHATLDAALVRTYSHVRLFRRQESESWSDAFSKKPLLLLSHVEPQGEAVGFALDGLSFYTVSEGSNPSLWYYEHTPCSE